MIDAATSPAGEHYISNFCRIRNGAVTASDFVMEPSENPGSFNEVMKTLYSRLELNYPKFFKMDDLSKLAFITSEILLKDKPLSSYTSDRIGVVLGNSFATLETDLEYYETINDKAEYFPSPSVFVYTLPNIMIGEICIRNKIKGENAFFVFKEFNHNFIHRYVVNLLQTGKIDCCITGWVDFRKSSYESVLFLIENKALQHHLPYTSEATRKIYSA